MVRLEVRFSWEDFLPPDSGAAGDEAWVLELFGEESRPFIFVAVAGADSAVWTPPGLTAVRAALDRLAGASWLAQVHSPFTSELLIDEDAALVSRVPLATLPRTTADALAVRDALWKVALPGARWVSRDRRAIFLALELAPAFYEDYSHSVEVYRELQKALTPLEAEGLELHLAGAPVVEARSALFLTREAALFASVAGALMALLLWISLGSAALAGMGLAIAASAVALLLGLLGLLQIPFTMMTVAAPVVVLVVVMCDLIHVASDYLRCQDCGLAPRAAFDEAYGRGVRTCFWTSATSAVGFAAFALSSIPAIRGFAVATSLGILGGYAVTMLVLPALLWRVQRPRDAGGAVDPVVGVAHPVGGACTTWRVACLDSLVGVVQRHPAKIVVAFGVLALLAAAAAATVTVDSSLFEDIDARQPIVVDNRYFARQFTGEAPVTMVVSFPPGQSALAPENAALLGELERRFQGTPNLIEVGGAIGLLRWAGEIYRGEQGVAPSLDTAAHDAPALDQAVPKAPELDHAARSQLNLLLDSVEPELLDRYLAHTPSERGAVEHARLDLRFSDPRAKETLALLRQVRAEVAERRPDVRVVYSGRFFRGMQALTDLTVESLWGFSAAAGAIFLLLVVALRSLRRALIAMVPNLLPLLVALGGFGLFDVNLKPWSMLILSVALGLAVDDTLHVVRRVAELEADRDLREAVTGALALTAVPVLRTTLVVGAGFAVLTLSASNAISLLGVAVLATAGVALGADLLLLPASLLLRARFAGDRDREVR